MPGNKEQILIPSPLTLHQHPSTSQCYDTHLGYIKDGGKNVYYLVGYNLSDEEYKDTLYEIFQFRRFKSLKPDTRIKATELSEITTCPVYTWTEANESPFKNIRRRIIALTAPLGR